MDWGKKRKPRRNKTVYLLHPVVRGKVGQEGKYAGWWEKKTGKKKKKGMAKKGASRRTKPREGAGF